MKVNLISFQEKAVQGLREDIADALDNYRRRGKTQVVSLQAPTGAGKTIIAAALIENIFFGSTLANGTTFDEQPEAIFVWLSDSPELNAQSKQKIELKTSKLRFGNAHGADAALYYYSVFGNGGYLPRLTIAVFRDESAV